MNKQINELLVSYSPFARIQTLLHTFTYVYAQAKPTALAPGTGGDGTSHNDATQDFDLMDCILDDKRLIFSTITLEPNSTLEGKILSLKSNIIALGTGYVWFKIIVTEDILSPPKAKPAFEENLPGR